MDTFVYVLQMCNLGLRFVLELCTLAAFAYWGIQMGNSTLMKILLGGGSVIVAMLIWGTFGSPKATIPLEGWIRALFEAAFFGLAALSLHVVGKHVWAAIFLIVLVGNWLLMYMWNQ
ncbi:YrdB family protein [Paenibacillus sp. KS1]|uniref:YrdB family protein n=1 Tax=Paenibacillus sp. KS1 TaxID=1849249 RepID=UPI000A724F52|nr:YrdB family protein [Paenibacillus sp. KS1]